ncbi:MAG: hypothetical protein V4539_17460 [Bacteroidota bacterium]
MKKLFILALIAIATGTTAFAGPSTTKAVTHFANTFSAAKNVSWNSNGRFQKVTFQLNNETISAFYDEDGDLLGTSKKVSFDKLPKAALETITSQYTFPEYQVLECIEFSSDKTETKYYTSFRTEDSTVVLEIMKNGRVSVFSETEK